MVPQKIPLPEPACFYGFGKAEKKYSIANTLNGTIIIVANALEPNKHQATSDHRSDSIEYNCNKRKLCATEVRMSTTLQFLCYWRVRLLTCNDNIYLYSFNSMQTVSLKRRKDSTLNLQKHPWLACEGDVWVISMIILERKKQTVL